MTSENMLIELRRQNSSKSSGKGKDDELKPFPVSVKSSEKKKNQNGSFSLDTSYTSGRIITSPIT